MSSNLSIPSPKTEPFLKQSDNQNLAKEASPTKTGQVPLRLLALIKCDDNQEKSLSEEGRGDEEW